jgi:hypothetical protein
MSSNFEPEASSCKHEHYKDDPHLELKGVDLGGVFKGRLLPDTVRHPMAGLKAAVLRQPLSHPFDRCWFQVSGITESKAWIPNHRRMV